MSIAKRIRRKTRAFRFSGPTGVLAGVLIAAVAGAGAVGAVLTGYIGGSTGMTVGQAIVVDRENFTTKDIGRWTDDKAVTFNDEGTGLTVAAEFQVGDTMVLDVPLANASDRDASAITTLNVSPGLRKEIEAFWSTEERTTTPAARTTTPSPAPVTSTVPQNSDTVAEPAPPIGTAGINAQVSDTTGTTSSPGLATSSPQTANTSTTTDKPSGAQDNAARAATTSAATNDPADVPGSTAITPRTTDSGNTTTQPTGLAGLVTARTVTFGAVTATPNGTPAIIAQTVGTGAGTTIQPTGAPTSQSGRWYTGQFQVDVNADGVKENVAFVLTDTAGAGTYNAMDLSSDDSTFGETTGGPLSNSMTGPDDDERITASGDVRLGPFYTFTVTFLANGSSASITSKTWFTTTISGTDLDGDGSADDTFYAAITDIDSDGLYDRLDLSIGNSVFGEGNLTDSVVDYSATDNTNDESISGAADVKMGANTFHFTFDTTPGGGA